MKTISMSKSSNSEIDAAVAEYVAGWRIDLPPQYRRGWSPIGADKMEKIPAFSTDANAVLELLDKCEWWTKTGYDDNITIGYRTHDYSSAQAEATARTFPLAACFALLRAHGVEVTE